mgnify:CR=1 FL=1
MSYTQKVLEELKARYPEQPEFIQAATEILGTIQPALDAHPEYERPPCWSASSSPSASLCSVSPGSTTRARSRSTAATASSSTLPLDLQGRPAL